QDSRARNRGRGEISRDLAGKGGIEGTVGAPGGYAGERKARHIARAPRRGRPGTDRNPGRNGEPLDADPDRQSRSGANEGGRNQEGGRSVDQRGSEYGPPVAAVDAGRPGTSAGIAMAGSRGIQEKRAARQSGGRAGFGGLAGGTQNLRLPS